MNEKILISDAIFVFGCILIMYTIVLSAKVFKMGHKKGFKAKFEACEMLRYKFRGRLIKLERDLIDKNYKSKGGCEFDEDIISVKLIKKELDGFSHGVIDITVGKPNWNDLDLKKLGLKRREDEN